MKIYALSNSRHNCLNTNAFQSGKYYEIEYKQGRFSRRRKCDSEYPNVHPVNTIEDYQPQYLDQVVKKISGRKRGDLLWDSYGYKVFASQKVQDICNRLLDFSPLNASEYQHLESIGLQDYKLIDAPYLDALDYKKSGFSVTHKCPVCELFYAKKRGVGLFFLEDKVIVNAFRTIEYPSFLFVVEEVAEMLISSRMLPVCITHSQELNFD